MFYFCIYDSQPAPAYDLLVRFLTKQSMIDVELPQVRTSMPVTPYHLPWMHLYPQGKKAFDASYAESPLLSHQSPASSSSVAASLSGGPNDNSFLATASNSSGSMGLLLAFVAGLVVALLTAHLVNRRSDRRRTGYCAVPDN